MKPLRIERQGGRLEAMVKKEKAPVLGPTRELGRGSRADHGPIEVHVTSGDGSRTSTWVPDGGALAEELGRALGASPRRITVIPTGFADEACTEEDE